jgi:hypothetical protein
MMVVDVEITFAGDREIEKAMPGEEFEHVVEKANTGRDLGAAGAVEAQSEADVGLPGRSDNLSTTLGHGIIPLELHELKVGRLTPDPDEL